MTRKLINPNEASLAAAFYLPAYQRLRQWHRGQAIDLLCFVDNIRENVKQLLEDSGAHPSREFRANCFAEIWQIPHDTLLHGRFSAEPCEIDKEISEALCSGGKYSAAAGFLAWGDRHEEERKRGHVRSTLLEDSRSTRRGPGR